MRPNLFDLPAGSHRAMFRGLVVLVEGLPGGAHQVVRTGGFGDESFCGSLNITLSAVG